MTIKIEKLNLAPDSWSRCMEKGCDAIPDIAIVYYSGESKGRCALLLCNSHAEGVVSKIEEIL